MLEMSSRTVCALLVAVCFAGCRTGTASASPEPPSAPEVALSSGPAERGIAMIHSAHCGGAMLTPEQQRSLSRPAAHLSFVVLAGDHNTAGRPVARFTTDEAGGFALPSLPAGTYCVVRASNQISAAREAELLALPPASPPPEPHGTETVVDQACLKRLPLKCDALWETAKPYFQPRVDLAGSQCPWSEPCTRYNGPLPP